MKIFRIVTLIALSLSLALIVLSQGILQQVATSSAISNLLGKGGVYEVVAEQTRSTLAASPRLPAKYQEIFAQSLATSVDAEQIEAMLKPGIVDIVTWFSQPASTPPPDIIIITKPAKDELVKGLSEGGLSTAELTALQADLNQQIPDQIRLSDVEDFVGGSSSSVLEGEASAEEPSKTGAAIDALKQAKSLIGIIQLIFMISCVLSLLLTLAIMWLSHRLGHTWLRAASGSLLAVGAVWTLIALVVPMLLRAPTEPATAQSISNHLLPIAIGKILQAGLLPSVLITLLGGIGLSANWLETKK